MIIIKCFNRDVLDYVIVYGGQIHAWTCLNFLLKYLCGYQIAFVENLNETTSCVDAFNNPSVCKCLNILI